VQNYLPHWTVWVLVLAFAKAHSQTPTDSLQRENIKVEAGFTDINETAYPGAVIYTKSLVEQVYIQHNGIEMYCDQALLYKEDNFVKAYGNVFTNQGDTLRMTSRYTEYDGNTELAFAAGDVYFTNPDTQLATDTLYFDRVKQQAYYRSGGTVRDTASTLTSRIGRFYVQENRYQFLDNVVVTNPKYTINSDHLSYYTETGTAYLYGPSTIEGEDSKIYCERGFYNTRADNGYFIQNAKVDYEMRELRGDSIYFDRVRDYASAVNNITVTDTVNNSIVSGHFAEVFKAKDSVFITQRALAQTIQEKDTIYTHADTLMITGPSGKREMRGFYNARILKGTVSGRSDSLFSDEARGITKMLGRPVLWDGLNQITGDTIQLYSSTQTEKIDSVRVFYNSFMIDKDSLLEQYDQIKGKELTAYFKNNSVYRVVVDKNVETLTYVKNDEDKLVGINKGRAGSIEVLITDQAVSDIFPKGEPYDQTYPPPDLPENARKLRGFLWRGDERITELKELFEEDPPLQLIKIKGIPLPEVDAEFFEEEVEVNEHSNLEKDQLKTRAIDKSVKYLQKPSAKKQ
jgi:lipopolysaccharide export system protein LptA